MMHQIPQFQEINLEFQHDHIRKNPFATVISMESGSIIVNHFPLVLCDTRAGKGTLQGHVARANTFWKNFDQATDVMAVFHGLDHYITPTYYPSKAQHDKVVPTWNYAVVHASGPLRIIQDKDWLLKHLTELTNKQEQENEVPWSVNDAPQKFVDIQLRGIVGFEIPISKIVGAMKMSQNKNEQDATGVVQGLRAIGSIDGHEVAKIVERNLKNRPTK
ncbi:MAG: FMN-binding negative transcriptional regulator [Devosiaceae bacterium]|nr:FMN-binding negative transcriptional regulator [Devosiaceae bacterium]